MLCLLMVFISMNNHAAEYKGPYSQDYYFKPSTAPIIFSSSPPSASNDNSWGSSAKSVASNAATRAVTDILTQAIINVVNPLVNPRPVAPIPQAPSATIICATTRMPISISETHAGSLTQDEYDKHIKYLSLDELKMLADQELKSGDIRDYFRQKYFEALRNATTVGEKK